MPSVLERLRTISAVELRFRAACELRKGAQRLRAAAVPPRWERTTLLRRLVPPAGSSHFVHAKRALHARDWHGAHKALACHFASAPRAFPLDPRNLPAVASSVLEHFPSAASDAAARAERILSGRYDLLGYRDLAVGTPPSWHADPVNGRSFPAAFWADVPYLDAACGDHKVVWELNRHQHWLALGRAFHLTGDRRCYVEFVAQLEGWIASNPPLVGGNWASMLELAFRSLSWIWALQLFAPAAQDDPPGAPPWTVDLLLALDRQLVHVEQNLSVYFSPNTHLTGEALALYVAGCGLPELRSAARFANTGRTVLVREAVRQINADGGHAELSTHYHRYSTDFYLLALQVARRAGDPCTVRFERAARRQAAYLRTMAGDDGRVPLIGDDDGGQLFPMCGVDPSDCRETLAAAGLLLESPELAVSPVPEATFWFCGTPARASVVRFVQAAWPSQALRESGYYVSRTPAGDHLVLDAGRHGYLNGGHAHADALSVNVIARRKPLIVDPGTGTYTMDLRMRDLFRATEMHNTVVVSGRSQSIPAGPFHWASRTDAQPSMWHSADGVDYAEGRHDGYAPVTHVRSIVAIHGLGWVIVDHLLGDGDVDARALWHVHPEWAVARDHESGVRLRHHDGSEAALVTSHPLEIVRDGHLAAFAPEYGRIERASCLRVELPGRLPCSIATLVLSEVAAGELTIDPLQVVRAVHDTWHGAAFRIRLGGDEGILLSAVERLGGPAGASAAPRRRWGVEALATDARVALSLGPAASDPQVLILVNGSTLELGGRVIDNPHSSGVVRWHSPAALAHPVHEAPPLPLQNTAAR